MTLWTDSLLTKVFELRILKKFYGETDCLKTKRIHTSRFKQLNDCVSVLIQCTEGPFVNIDSYFAEFLPNIERFLVKDPTKNILLFFLLFSKIGKKEGPTKKYSLLMKTFQRRPKTSQKLREGH